MAKAPGKPCEQAWPVEGIRSSGKLPHGVGNQSAVTETLPMAWADNPQSRKSCPWHGRRIRKSGAAAQGMGLIFREAGGRIQGDEGQINTVGEWGDGLDHAFRRC